MKRPWSLVPGLLALLLAPMVPAQERLEVLGPDPATISLGDVARVEIRVTDPGPKPRQFRTPEVDGLQLRLSGPSQHTEILGGQRPVHMLVWTLELVPAREGTFVVPPFAVYTGSKDQQTPELRLDVRKDLGGSKTGYLVVEVSPRRVYVHEPIRVRVEAGVQQGLRIEQGRASNGQGFFDVEVQAPWLYDFPNGEPMTMAPPQRNAALVVQGGNNLMPAVYDDGHDRDGERYRRFQFERAFLPTRPGPIELAAPTFRYNVVRQPGRQDIFGLSRGGVTQQCFAYGEPITIEVLPIPEAGRPTPYYGAVGRFTLDAALDRDSVRRGSSVKLTLTVRGQGNLEFLRLPALDDLPGFHKLGQAEAKRDAEKVVVAYDLAPLSTDVKEVPAIDWNWFDTTPGVEKFVTTKTSPLPLRVTELPAGETLAPLPESAAKAVTLGVDDIFDLPSFAGPPLRASALPAGSALLAAGLPWLVVGMSVLFLRWRRARSADVVGQRARSAARTFAQALRDGSEPLDAFATYLGDRLGVPAAAVISVDLRERLRTANVADDLADAAVAAIERGTAGRYGGGGGLAAADAQALVQRLQSHRFGAHSWLPFVLPMLAVVALGNAPAIAQAGPASDAVALYRAGEHQQADAAFAQAFAATGDRRFLQARGNCLFRLGDLPRALWAFESARLARPRDPELAANVALVRTRLELPPDAPGLLAELNALRARLLPGEQLALAGVCMLLAAMCLGFGWRRVGLRWVAGILALPAGWMLATLALAGSTPTSAIAIDTLRLTSEPRAGLEPLATVRPGVQVTLLGGGEGSYVRIAAGERSGYVPRTAIAIVE